MAGGERQPINAASISSRCWWAQTEQARWCRPRLTVASALHSRAMLILWPNCRFLPMSPMIRGAFPVGGFLQVAVSEAPSQTLCKLVPSREGAPDTALRLTVTDVGSVCAHLTLKRLGAIHRKIPAASPIADLSPSSPLRYFQIPPNVTDASGCRFKLEQWVPQLPILRPGIPGTPPSDRLLPLNADCAGHV